MNDGDCDVMSGFAVHCSDMSCIIVSCFIAVYVDIICVVSLYCRGMTYRQWLSTVCSEIGEPGQIDCSLYDRL
jgi:hypothetical protein